VTDINPKDAAALKKVPMHLLPDVGVVYGAMACLDGALKYGPYNWRERSISLMLYIGALKRHLAALEGGEDDAKDSKLPHLAHVVATASILLDAKEAGALIDDRPKRQADVAGLIERMNAVVAARVAVPVQAAPATPERWGLFYVLPDGTECRSRSYPGTFADSAAALAALSNADGALHPSGYVARRIP
jgi:hypothetical protein